MTNMFKAPQAPAPPTPIPPPTMPDPLSPDALEARRTAMAKAAQGGRSSTILTNAASRAGSTIAGQVGGAGGAYGSAKTGA